MSSATHRTVLTSSLGSFVFLFLLASPFFLVPSNVCAATTVTTSCTVVINAPDLTAGAISPTTAIAGSAVTLSGTASNIGNASSGVSFPSYFLINNAAGGGGTTVLATNPTAGPIAAGGSASISQSYTFPSAGTYSAVLCADYTAGWGSTIAESNESNNCGPWTNITVYAVPTATLTASPPSIVSGESTTLTWTSTNATTCTGTNFSTANATNNSTGVNVAPTVNTTYTLTCTGPGGTAVNSKTVTIDTVAWVNMQCGDVTNSYNNTCNPTAEPVSINCPEGQRLQGREVSGLGCFPPNNSTKSQRRCIADATCPISMPDLTAGTSNFTAQSGSPYVWAGQVFTYTGTVSNIGNKTSTSFSNIFHIENWGQIPATTLTLGVGASSAVSGTTAIGTAGTYRVRTCADNTIAWVGSQTESNEGNNCGTYFDFSVAPAIPTGLAASCNANGTSATLSWNAVPNTSFYYVRVVKPTGSACPSGWQNASWAPTTTCIPNPDSVLGTSIVYPSTPGFASTLSVHSAISNGAWSPSASIGFTCNGAPDLSVSGITPTSAVSGTPVTLSSTISNTGNASTGAGFTNLFQRATDSAGTGAADIGTYAAATLANGSSVNGTLSYTFPSAATWYVRACADKASAAGTGTITESNEGNNCGTVATPWTPVTVTAPTPQCRDGGDNDTDGYQDFVGSDPSCSNMDDTTETPASPKATLSCTSPSPCTVIPPASATLTYSATNATSCAFVDSGATGTGPSTRVVNPTGTQPVTYDFYCTNSGTGETSVHAFATVNILNPTVYITASGFRVNSGGSVNLTWSAGQTGVGSCSMTKNGSAFTPPGAPANLTTDGSTNIATTSPVAQTITGQTVYKITCGTVSSTVVINLNAQELEF